MRLFLLSLMGMFSISAFATQSENDVRRLALALKQKIKAARGNSCLSPEMMEGEIDKLLRALPNTVAGGESSGGHTIPRRQRPTSDQLAGGESSGGRTIPPTHF